MVICPECGAKDSHIVQLMLLLPHHLTLHQIYNNKITFLVLVYQGCLENWSPNSVLVVTTLWCWELA